MKEAILQLFTGGFEGASVPFEAVKARLDALLPQTRATKIVAGWSPDASLNKKLCAYLDEKGVELYLWLPAFSEIGAVERCAPVVDVRGAPVSGGGWHEAESFEFYCPADERNVNNAIKVFERLYASAGFGGVFLDKIRYPTFANGANGIYTCFCPVCAAKYKARGLNTDAFNQLPPSVTRYERGTYTIDGGAWDAFFSYKCTLVTEAVATLCHCFRDKGYKVGLDVLAPFAGRLAGQDIAALSQHCDFMKPMLYRITRAPAGMPCELDAIAAALCGGDADKRRAFLGALGVDGSCAPFSLSFTLRELDAAVDAARCPIFPGIEVNRKAGVCDARPAYIAESASAYLKHGAAGLALSWDVMDAPDENVNSAVAAL